MENDKLNVAAGCENDYNEKGEAIEIEKITIESIEIESEQAATPIIEGN